jgi:hypothetical protein
LCNYPYNKNSGKKGKYKTKKSPRINPEARDISVRKIIS